MPVHVTILGSGVAACGAARLLSSRGYRVSGERESRLSGPTLLINESTRRLLADVFPRGEAALAGGIAIRRRVVLWGAAAAPVELPHAGIALDEAALLNSLWDQMNAPAAPETSAADWTLVCSARGTPPSRRTFGTREALAVRVALRGSPRDTCWVESLDSGWLFLLPSDEGEAALLATGGEADTLLAQSRLIAPLVHRRLPGESTRFSTSPSLLYPPCGPGWLACGSAAMSLDPICGEGAGNSIREAILASSIIAAADNGEARVPLLAHYTARLLAGFIRHLTVSGKFYTSGGAGEWWRRQAAGIDAALAWAKRELAALPPPRYRLHEFDLEPLASPVRLQ
mgnify:CR=1 FL=1